MRGWKAGIGPRRTQRARREAGFTTEASGRLGLASAGPGGTISSDQRTACWRSKTARKGAVPAGRQVKSALWASWPRTWEANHCPNMAAKGCGNGTCRLTLSLLLLPFLPLAHEPVYSRAPPIFDRAALRLHVHSSWQRRDFV